MHETGYRKNPHGALPADRVPKRQSHPRSKSHGSHDASAVGFAHRASGIFRQTTPAPPPTTRHCPIQTNFAIRIIRPRRTDRGPRTSERVHVARFFIPLDDTDLPAEGSRLIFE